MLVDDQPLGTEMDFHNDEGGGGATHVVPTGEVRIGEVELSSGTHEFKLQCMGKNPRSTAHFLAVDGFLVAPVR